MQPATNLTDTKNLIIKKITKTALEGEIYLP